jgi:hypothetical protein
VAYSGGYDVWFLSNSIKKSNIVWPQQPPTEKVLEFNMIFHHFTHNLFSKHQNKAKCDILDDSEILISDFPGLKTSAASMTSMTSTASFHQKTH